MADKIRNNTFLIKRSNVPGKVPTAGSLLLGELALNISDVILYASGTTANSILPIGWDRVSRTGDTMTGGLFTPFLSATTISATSINKVDYIIFNTGTTSATTFPGTVYFDNTEKALSYNTSINQLVTVNLGQQNYIRVFNDSGTDIQRGKALEVLSAFSGLPSVTLAINKNTGFNIIGVSAEIIPNNSEGIVITNGIISNIELTGMTVGSLVYASDTVAGNLDNATKFLSFPLSARTNSVGYVVQTGITTGKLFVDINNENSILTLTDLERNVLEGNTISTGAFEYTGMTTASTTTFNVAPLKGWIVKNTYEYATLPDVLGINYTGGTNISVTNILTADSTYILLTSGLTITQQVTFPTPQERRENIFLGKINHPNRTSILNINNTVDYDVSPMSSLRDLWSPIRLINDGIIPSPNGANLSFNTSAGILWGNGINWHNNQLSPNNVIIAAKVPASFFYRTQTGGTTSSVTVIDPRNYDVGGVITSIGNANLDSATNQRIYLYPSGIINVLYGQTVYTSLAAAVAAVQSEAFIPYPNAASTGILIGILSVRNDIGTDGQPLTNASYAKFTFVSKFGESFGGTGGLSTTTLQQAYDNSSTPEITINAVLDGLSIKNGTGNADNVTRLFEGITATNGATSFIRADGYISGTTFQTNSFIANNGGATATTFNILTLGSGTSITNLGVDINGRVVTGTTGGNGSTFTGGTINGPTNFTNGLTANTISATTYYNLPIDVYSTGGTYNGANLYITNNTGGTFTITGLTATGFSANYYGSFSDTTIQPVTGASSPTVWKYNTTELSNGISVVNSSQIKVANKGVYEIGYSAQIEKTGIGTSTDVTIWASINGTPVTRSSSTLTFANNNSYQLPFVSYIFELEANDYVEFYFSSPSTNVQITTLSGLTSPTRPDAPSVIIVAKQVGLSVTDNLGGYYLPLSGGTVTGGTSFNSGLTANTISATTYYNLPTDVYVTGATYSSNTFTYTNNTGGTFNVLFNTLTGLTVNGDLNVTGSTTSNSLSATTITGTTIYGNGSNLTGVVKGTGTNNYLAKWTGTTGISNSIIQDDGTNVGVGASIVSYAKLNVVTTTGNTEAAITALNNNIGASGIKALSYDFGAAGIMYGVYGEAYDAGTTNIGVYGYGHIVDWSGVNAIGGKFEADGASNNYSVQLIDGTEGINKFLKSVTSDGKANWSDLPTDIRVTGTTYSDNTFTYTNNTGGTFNVLFNTVTGLTITGNLYVSGNTQSRFSGNSSVELVLITQTGTGDAFVVEDSANSDSSHFVINASGDTAIGLLQPLGGDKLTVSGNTTVYGTLKGTTISATTYQNLPLDIRVTGATYSNNTFTYTNNTGGTFSTLFNTLTGLTINGNLTVTGNTSVQGLSGTTATLSGSGQNILTIIGSGSTLPLFSIIGSTGELFSVTDSLTGSLFSVNDISGLPILEVFSDNTTLMGNYLAPSLNTTTKVTLTAGTNTVYSIPTSAYTGAFFDYTVISTGSTGARAGNIMAIWSGTTAQYSETSTNDIGNTAGITFSVAVSGNNAVLSSSATTAGWTLKTIIRSI